MNFLDLLFPRSCLGCGRPGSYFCQKCSFAIRLFHPQRCPKCEKPSLGGITHLGCRKKEPLDGLISIFPYEGLIRAAIGKLKYRFVTDLADEFSRLIIRTVKLKATHLTPALRDMSKILVPIPLHWYRRNWRGFNQAELLGEKLAAYFGLKIASDLLIRQKRTLPQVELKGGQRQRNIQGAFRTSPNPPAGGSQYPNILLFDDVWTTGSTMDEAARVLKKSGAKGVWGLTIAR